MPLSQTHTHRRTLPAPEFLSKQEKKNTYTLISHATAQIGSSLIASEKQTAHTQTTFTGTGQTPPPIQITPQNQTQP